MMLYTFYTYSIRLRMASPSVPSPRSPNYIRVNIYNTCEVRQMRIECVLCVYAAGDGGAFCFMNVKKYKNEKK